MNIDNINNCDYEDTGDNKLILLIMSVICSNRTSKCKRILTAVLEYGMYGRYNIGGIDSKNNSSNI